MEFFNFTIKNRNFAVSFQNTLSFFQNVVRLICNVSDEFDLALFFKIQKINLSCFLSSCSSEAIKVGISFMGTVTLTNNKIKLCSEKPFFIKYFVGKIEKNYLKIKIKY